MGGAAACSRSHGAVFVHTHACVWRAPPRCANCSLAAPPSARTAHSRHVPLLPALPCAAAPRAALRGQLHTSLLWVGGASRAPSQPHARLMAPDLPAQKRLPRGSCSGACEQRPAGRGCARARPWGRLPAESLDHARTHLTQPAPMRTRRPAERSTQPAPPAAASAALRSGAARRAQGATSHFTPLGGWGLPGPLTAPRAADGARPTCAEATTTRIMCKLIQAAARSVWLRARAPWGRLTETKELTHRFARADLNQLAAPMTHRPSSAAHSRRNPLLPALPCAAAPRAALSGQLHPSPPWLAGGCRATLAAPCAADEGRPTCPDAAARSIPRISACVPLPAARGCGART
jgi:hypothetical protein